MKPGIHADVSEAEYHARPELSQSQAKTILDCPARYIWERDHPTPPTPQMEAGTVIHALTLGQPDTHQVIDAPSKRGKAWADAADAARAAGLIPVLPDELATYQACAAAVHDHPWVAAAMTRGRAEQTMTWTDPDTGVPCRGRVDWLTATSDGAPVIVDLKTTASVEGGDRAWAATVARYGYHVQAGAYTHGHEVITGDAPTFFMVAVERTPPHLVRVWQPTPDTVQRGHDRWADALTIHRQCTDTGHWPAYPTNPVPFDLPAWA